MILAWKSRETQEPSLSHEQGQLAWSNGAGSIERGCCRPCAPSIHVPRPALPPGMQSRKPLRRVLQAYQQCRSKLQKTARLGRWGAALEGSCRGSACAATQRTQQFTDCTHMSGKQELTCQGQPTQLLQCSTPNPSRAVDLGVVEHGGHMGARQPDELAALAPVARIHVLRLSGLRQNRCGGL